MTTFLDGSPDVLASKILESIDIEQEPVYTFLNWLLIRSLCNIIEPRCEKTGFWHMRS